jgi:hypothetical protein
VLLCPVKAASTARRIQLNGVSGRTDKSAEIPATRRHHLNAGPLTSPASAKHSGEQSTRRYSVLRRRHQASPPESVLALMNAVT